ncbi:hypothetical protein GOP47_0030730 [Adiantum capillus-veneris]|nr:hypothetical protein GOP47_0030730 [Adiantum capillus-veneris]
MYLNACETVKTTLAQEFSTQAEAIKEENMQNKRIFEAELLTFKEDFSRQNSELVALKSLCLEQGETLKKQSKLIVKAQANISSLISTVEDLTECNICMITQKTEMFFPCGHFQTCENCVQLWQQAFGNGQLYCPWCGSRVHRHFSIIL